MSFDVATRFKYTLTIVCLVAVTCLLSARLFYFYLDSPLRFPINTIQVVASYQHITRAQLETILSHYQQKSFFTLPVHQLYAELMQFPWVEQVDIEREWPDIVHITFKEKQAIATWNGAILTDQGSVIPDKEALSKLGHLPRLMGTESNLNDVRNMYQQLSAAFNQYGLKMESLEQRHNQAWEVTLTNGILLKVGKQDVLARAERFCKVYPILSERQGQILSVDLRYPKAMAVQWQVGTALH